MLCEVDTYIAHNTPTITIFSHPGVPNSRAAKTQCALVPTMIFSQKDLVISIRCSSKVKWRGLAKTLSALECCCRTTTNLCKDHLLPPYCAHCTALDPILTFAALAATFIQGWGVDGGRDKDKTVGNFSLISIFRPLLEQEINTIRIARSGSKRLGLN